MIMTIETTEDLNTLFSKDLLTKAFKRAIWNGLTVTAEFLLDHGVEIPQDRNAYDIRYNPLRLAAERGHYGLARKLLDRGFAKEWSCGATLMSVYSGNTDLLKLFLDRGIADESELREASNAAKRQGYADCIVLLEVALRNVRQQADTGTSAPAP
jgi:ankyrin repeat protein